MSNKIKSLVKKDFISYGEKLYYMFPRKKDLNSLLILIKELMWDTYSVGKGGLIRSFDELYKNILVGVRRGIASTTKENPVTEYKHIRPKEYFDKDSFRYKRVGDKLVLIGCRKGMYNKKTHRCKEGTKAQKIMQYE
jgi:hypothetical protein